MEMEIAKFFFPVRANANFKLALIFRQGKRRLFFGKYLLAFGEEGHFETGDASETPASVGDGLDECGLFGADGLKLLFVTADVGGVASGVFFADGNNLTR